MRIVDERAVKATHKFNALQIGDVFHYPSTPEEIWMKIYPVIDEDNVTLNAVNLSTGEVDYFCENEFVTIANAELVVRN